MFDRQRKYAIRKIAIGTISAVIGSFMVGSTDASANEVNIDYKYVTLNELTEDEKKLIKTNQHELVAQEDTTYYMVYRPVTPLPTTSASLSADNMIGAGLALGSVLLLAAVSVGKNRRKRLTSLIVLTTAGTSIIAPNAFAIENKELRRYNQELSLQSQADLPDPLKIDGYEFIGYIELPKEKAVESKPELPLVKEPVQVETTQTKAPVTRVTAAAPATRVITQAPVTQIVTEAPATKVVTQAPVTKVVTEAPVTKVVTEAPVTKVVTEAPVTRVVTEAPVTRIVTQAPVTQIVSDASTTQIVTQAPVTQIVTEAPATRIVTEAPATKIVTEAPVTKVVTEAPVTKVVTEAPVTKVVTEKPKENLVVEEKTELTVVQGTEERVVETQELPFETRYEEDANLWEGETQVVTPGTKGQKEVVDTYPTVNGTIVSTPTRTERVVKESSEQVEKRGTKPVLGQVEEVVTTSVERKTQYVENLNAEPNTKTTISEGRDEVKEIHNLYETIKGEKTKLISTEERAIITSEDKVIAVGIKPSEREEITAKHSVIYQADETMAHTAEPVTKQEGKDEITKYKTTYLLDKLSGNVTANPETSEKTQDRQDMIVIVGTMPTTRTETRKYSVEYKSSDTLEVGQEQIETKGKDGSVLYTTTYTVDPTTGKVTANPETEQVTEAVVNQVILVGTKPRVVTRTINYTMEDGSLAPKPEVQTVEFTKEILSTDPATGLRTYSDWKSANDKFASVTSPEVPKYTAQTNTVEEKSVTADSQNETVDVLYKVNIIESEDKRVVKRTINYLYEEDKNKALDPFIQELTYTRTKFTNEVTGEVKYGDWNLEKQDFIEKLSPELDGYMPDIEKVEVLPTTPESKDVEVTVLYTDKFIEIKDVDEAALFVVEPATGASKIMSLENKPGDLSNYFVRVNSDRFKEMQLKVDSITETTKDGKVAYKVTAVHPKLKQDETYDGYEDKYTFYVAKADSALTGIKTFKELLEKVKADPAGTYTLANDLSAEGYDLSAKDSFYIETFKGTLNGENNGKKFAIYDLKAPLFSNLEAAKVLNLDLKNVDIDANSYSTVASLAQNVRAASLIQNVTAQGSIEVSNNYGSYDSAYSGDGLRVGGLVANLNESTVENSAFKGNIDVDSTAIRYMNNNRTWGSTSAIIGGLIAAAAGGNAQIKNNKVSADILINAVDGAAMNTNPGQPNAYVLGQPVLAGGLLGDYTNNSNFNIGIAYNQVEGTIDNQIDNKNVVYMDGVSREDVIGNVAGLVGSTRNGNMANGAANHPNNTHNLIGMKVTNGALSIKQSANPRVNTQRYLEGVASATHDGKGGANPATEAEIATIKATHTAELDDSNQFITNKFDVDYTKVKGYNDAYKVAYQNMEKLLPFYNREFLVRMANKLAADDKLVTTELLSATPMKDKDVVSDISGKKTEINKLLLNYVDGKVDYKELAYKSDFKDTNIAEYKIAGTDLLFTTDQFVNSYENIINEVLPELQAVEYTGNEIWTALSTDGNQVDKINDLYLYDTFKEIKATLSDTLKNVLGTSTVYGDTKAVADYIKKNKAELLLGLSYINKWYNIDFKDTNIQKIATFQQDFFGKAVETLDWLIEVGSSGYRALDPLVNDEKTATFLGENNNTETLHDYLEKFRERFAGDMTAAAWFYNAAKAYVVEARAYDQAGKEIGNATLYDQLNKRLVATSNVRGQSVDYSNMILPLLTAKKDKIYIISSAASMQFGSLETYADAKLEETDPVKYEEALKKAKSIVDKEANNQAKHWEVWQAITKTDKLNSNKATWDTYYFADGKTWSAKHGDAAMDAVKDFFGPVGRYRSAPTANQEAYSDGNNIVFVKFNALSQAGQNNVNGIGGTGGSIWTHEQAHVWDGAVYLGGHGRRSGANMEVYAEGLLQAPRDYRIRNAIGVNLYHDYTSDNNPFPEYNSSPERFQSAEDLKQYVKGMMDVLYVMDYAEAKALVNLDPAEQAKRLTQLTAVKNNDKANNDKFVALTTEQITAMNLKDINSFVENNLALSRTYGNNKVGNSANPTPVGDVYVNVNMFTPFYGLSQNATGLSGAYTFRRAAFEMLAEYGYQGFVDYASGKYATDTEAVNAILAGTGYSNLTDFKKGMFAQRVAKLDSLKPVTFKVGNTTYTINNSTDLQNYMDTLVKAGNNNQITAFKQAMYVAYLKDTNEFKSSIFTK